MNLIFSGHLPQEDETGSWIPVKKTKQKKENSISRMGQRNTRPDVKMSQNLLGATLGGLILISALSRSSEIKQKRVITPAAGQRLKSQLNEIQQLCLQSEQMATQNPMLSYECAEKAFARLEAIRDLHPNQEELDQLLGRNFDEIYATTEVLRNQARQRLNPVLPIDQQSKGYYSAQL